MPDRNQTVLDFLLTRRSRPQKTLIAPVPEREEIEVMLTAAARTPDHGKLEPWRFIVLQRKAMERLGKLAAERAKILGLEDESSVKGRSQFDTGRLAVVVVEAPVISDKIPQIEQTYSAGAVCLALLNAALASGWGANWLSSWPSHDRGFVEMGLGLAPHERVAGIIHIGTEKFTPPERPRPDLATKTTWVSK